MNWDRWLMTEHADFREFTPYEVHADGSFDVIVGMCLITSLDEIIERGAVKVVQVDDIDTLENPRIVFERPAELTRNHSEGR